MEPVRMQPLEFVKSSFTDGTFTIPAAGRRCNYEAYAHPIFAGDGVNFQLQVPACPDAENIISNPGFDQGDNFTQTFWTAGPSIIPEDPSIYYDNGAEFLHSFAYIQQSSAGKIPGQAYFIRIYVNVPNNAQFVNGTLEVTGFTEVFEMPASTGVYTFYGIAGAGSLTVITARDLLDGQAKPVVTQVEVYPIEIPTMHVTDIDGVSISTDGFLYQFSPPFLNVTYSSETEPEEECFRIGVERGCDTPLISEVIEYVEQSDEYLMIGQCDNSNIHDGQLFGRFRAFIAHDQPHQIDRFTSRDSKGRFFNNYSNVLRVYSLKFSALPRHKRDFVTWLTASNTVTIRQLGQFPEDYFVHETPEVALFPEKEYGLAPMQLIIVPKEELNEHIFENDCKVYLPPKVLGQKSTNIAISAGTESAFEVKP